MLHGPTLLLSLGHVTLRSADFERTERFYCGLLGLRNGPRPAIAVPGRWFYIGEHAVLHVLPRLAGTQARAGGAVDHFALDAVDRPAFEARLRAAGQPFRCARLADTDTWQLFLDDPDGARVDLCFAGALSHPAAGAAPR
jgi:catechol 2,3-dioxygenase-like lactoylglutathione lyase family enzyme